MFVIWSQHVCNTFFIYSQRQKETKRKKFLLTVYK